MAHLEALGAHRLGDGPQRLSLSPQSYHLAYCRVFAFMQRQLALLTPMIAKRNNAAEVTATRLLVSLDLSDPFADAVALGLSEGGRDGQEQLREPIARNIAAKVQ
jgi:hypothetical protein